MKTAGPRAGASMVHADDDSDDEDSQALALKMKLKQEALDLMAKMEKEEKMKK